MSKGIIDPCIQVTDDTEIYKWCRWVQGSWKKKEAIGPDHYLVYVFLTLTKEDSYWDAHGRSLLDFQDKPVDAFPELEQPPPSGH